MPPPRQRYGLGLLLLGGIAVVLTGPGQVLLDRQQMTTLLVDLDPVGQVAGFIGLQIIATAVGVPGTVLVVVGGAVFGLFWGTLWSVLGASLGAVVAFCLARYCFHSWFARRFSQHRQLIKVNQQLCDRALVCVLLLRLAPISPFNLVNFLLGLTSVPLKPYALGTLAGITPGTLAYTWLGVTGSAALQGDGWGALSLSIGLLLLLSFVPLWLTRRH